QTVSAVRAALSDLGLNQPASSPIVAGRPSDASPTARATIPARPAPAVSRPRQPAATEADAPPRTDGGSEDAAPAVQVIDDPETQAGLALLEEQGDIVVPVIGDDGAEVNVSLRQALAEADAELQYGRPEAFNAAVVCAMSRGT